VHPVTDNRNGKPQAMGNWIANVSLAMAQPRFLAMLPRLASLDRKVQLAEALVQKQRYLQRSGEYEGSDTPKGKARMDKKVTKAEAALKKVQDR